jgi:hypothetical protein
VIKGGTINLSFCSEAVMPRGIINYAEAALMKAWNIEDGRRLSWMESFVTYLGF